MIYYLDNNKENLEGLRTLGFSLSPTCYNDSEYASHINTFRLSGKSVYLITTYGNNTKKLTLEQAGTLIILINLGLDQDSIDKAMEAV